ncbi:MAG: Altered inheritance of mitochondria protein 24, mitochondrial [Cirrosporium novae-zelandiae]|nr:MAG: Altered inheritance of mitochondria protein 24, mitochondrial [Cirrosporium novae-zelandiae]
MRRSLFEIPRGLFNQPLPLRHKALLPSTILPISITRRCAQFNAGQSSPSRDLSDLRPDLPPIEHGLTPEARFEVLGAPYSLLSVSLSASSNLYTRRGTLVGVSGKAENAVSTLRVLEPFRRALLRIPFLYQRISSTTPLKLIISTKSPITSFAVVHLDGTMDWMVAQRQGILAWTGHSMWIQPTTNMRLSLAHWGNSRVGGRGLLALIGRGHIHEITLKEEEQFVVHPSNVIAYTLSKHPPLPYRLKSSTLRFQVPDLGSILPDTKFFRDMRESDMWKRIGMMLFHLRTWSRRTIWGDRLFLQFHGPTTILLQSRASRVSDALTTTEVSEIADSPAGALQSAVTLTAKKDDTNSKTSNPRSVARDHTKLNYASVGSGGKIDIKETESFHSKK